MTDRSSKYRSERFRRRLKRRHARGAVLQGFGIGAILLGLTMLVLLVGSIVANGYTAFQRTEIRLTLDFDAETLGVEPGAGPQDLQRADYGAIIEQALERRLGEPESRSGRRQLTGLMSDGASFFLRDRLMADPELIGRELTLWLPANGAVDLVVKGITPRDVPESERNITDRQLAWVDQLSEAGDLGTHFNTAFFTNSTSREPELAGIFGAAMGSILTLIVTLVLTLPISIAAAVYLEEFAPKNRWTELIEVNINNLAAVPSIIYGLLGLAVFLNFLGMPRSAPISGGVVLALMTLPIIVIAARSALKAVPPSIRQAALMAGASPQQVVMYSVLPVALPSMLTGTIIGMAQALGETAPLLLMGMIAFVAEAPSGFTDSATVLPVQIYLWAESPGRGFVEKSSAAIMILLVFLVAMNATAIYLRKRFERRW
jgi:phosphate transport system permease protein